MLTDNAVSAAQCLEYASPKLMNSLENLRPPTYRPTDRRRTRPPITGRRVGGLDGEVD